VVVARQEGSPSKKSSAEGKRYIVFFGIGGKGRRLRGGRLLGGGSLHLASADRRFAADFADIQNKVAASWRKGPHSLLLQGVTVPPPGGKEKREKPQKTRRSRG